MILLDTDVLSEMIRPAPAPEVLRWLAAQPAASVFVSAVTEAELRDGVVLLQDGKRRAALAAAVAYAALAFTRREAGRAIAQADAEIAAIARSRGADLATRNVSDFEGCGIKIMTP